MKITPVTLTCSGWNDYQLLDSGDGCKLEQFGPYRLARFEPQAIWKPALSTAAWKEAQARFTITKGSQTGDWHVDNDLPREWPIGVHDMNIELRISQSRHVGIFPEQFLNWEWLESAIHASKSQPRLLNLFGYTGVASLLAARAGALVTHVDSSRTALNWARKNQELSGMTHLPIRWIAEDALKFVRREARRGAQYQAILMDPPRFGRGPSGEVWKFEKSVSELIQTCIEILAPNALLFCLTAYDIPNTPAEISQWLAATLKLRGGLLEYGWLQQLEKSAGRKIRQALFTRWSLYN